MADILIVAATLPEIVFLSSRLRKAKPGTITTVSKGRKNNLDVLVTGPGIVATTHQLTKSLNSKKYDLAINLGICGSFDKHLSPVRVVQVISDCLGDFGAEDGKNFIDAFELGFYKQNSFPFHEKNLKATYTKPLKSLKAIPSVAGVTVQKTTGSPAGKKLLLEKYKPVVESMEGAAFFYVCSMEKVKSLQIRAISNMVEKRNRENWKITEAISALEGITGLLLMELDALQP